jgi:hypothetical protein
VEDEIIVNKGYLDDLGTADLIAMPIYLILIVFIARIIKQKHIQKEPFYKYLTLGLYCRIFGAIAFCFVYTYYYKGGDTIGYYESVRAFVNLLIDRPSDFVSVYFSPASTQGFNTFDGHTGYPWGYLYHEERTLFLIKLLTPTVFLSFKSYLLSNIVISVLVFSGSWQMYKLFVRYYPAFQKQAAIGLLFVPTVIFWGSGMIKDSVTLSGICWFISSFEKIFISKQKRKQNVIVFLLAGYIVLQIKPYIIMAAIPGMIIWLLYSRIYKIGNTFLRYATIPFVFAASVGLGLFIMSQLGDVLGKFSIDKIMETAAVTQDDLKRDYYKGSSFDIGKIEPTVEGFVSKSPEATIAGLFRPFIWEARNIVVFLSGVENLILLSLCIICLVRLKIFGLFKHLFDNPLLLFLFLYSVLFAFSIGISTSNFGALTRFKVAFLPFFATTFLLLFKMSSKKYRMYAV